jgi:hypothetical protein
MPTALHTVAQEVKVWVVERPITSRGKYNVCLEVLIHLRLGHFEWNEYQAQSAQLKVASVPDQKVVY